MRQGGRYVVERAGATPRRVEWTRSPAEAAAERAAEKAKRARAAKEAAAKTPPKGGEK